MRLRPYSSLRGRANRAALGHDERSSIMLDRPALSRALTTALYRCVRRAWGMKQGYITRAVVTFGWTLALGSASAIADSWARPGIQELFSESREYFVRILPGESLGDTFGFAGAKKGRYATAEFYRRAKDRSYQLVTEATLVNPIAPVEAMVGNDGHLVTIDNWHNMGHGKVVSIYDSHGIPIRSYELRELFQPDEIERFPVSVSSIHWRSGPVYIRGDQKTVLITVRSGADIVFGLESGRFKYCESHNKFYRCRIANDPREWMPNSRVELTR